MDNKKHLLLIGGGHGHLAFINLFKYEKKRLKITLISENDYQYYSGMISGYLRGQYDLEACRLNLRKICDFKQLQWVCGRVEIIQPACRKVFLEDGRQLSYDYLSIDVGSQSQSDWAIRPISNLVDMREKGLLEDIGSIRGCGYGGLEIAGALGGNQAIDLIRGNHGFLKSMPRAIKDRIERDLRQMGVRIVTDCKESHGHELDAYSRRAQVTLEAGGKEGPHGQIIVDQQLRLVGFQSVFALGDCCQIQGMENLRKNGFHAIEQGKFLVKNMTALLSSKPLLTYKPRQSHLSILPISSSKGVLSFGRLYLYNAWCLKVKKWIDKRYMKEMKKMEGNRA